MHGQFQNGHRVSFRNGNSYTALPRRQLASHRYAFEGVRNSSHEAFGISRANRFGVLRQNTQQIAAETPRRREDASKSLFPYPAPKGGKANATVAVCLVARNRLLREALARFLGKSEKISVCKVFPCLPSIPAELLDTHADVIILDSLGAEPSERKLLAEIHSHFPALKIVLIDMEEDHDLFMYSIRAGATGYLLKDASAADVASAVRSVDRDETACPPKLCWTLFHHTSQQWMSFPREQIKLHLGLTRRQQQIVPLIAQGLTNKEIGAQLHLSEQTIKNHVHRMLQRVGANDRLAVVEMTRSYARF
jgi:DNA-binding NarL/FixJ family response regulator